MPVGCYFINVLLFKSQVEKMFKWNLTLSKFHVFSGAFLLSFFTYYTTIVLSFDKPIVCQVSWFKVKGSDLLSELIGEYSNNNERFTCIIALWCEFTIVYSFFRINLWFKYLLRRKSTYIILIEVLLIVGYWPLSTVAAQLIFRIEISQEQ